MRVNATFAAVLGLALFGGAVDAQSNPAHTHMGHVSDGFRGTPEGQGLLPTAVAEAEIAARHAGLAARDPSNLEAMQNHTRHVLHAIDPSTVENGPGLGYGVKPAAAGVARHIELAAAAEGASDAVTTHATHVATAAGNVVARSDRIIELGNQILAATSASDAASTLEELNAVAQQLVPGTDANGDGRTGWQEGEGGLEQAQTHMGLMRTAEGLGG
jgi:hypothetical protein